MQTASADVPTNVRHRSVTATVTLTRPDGTPLAGRPVTVEQVRHAFGFGNIGFDFIELANGETETGPRVFGGAARRAGSSTWPSCGSTSTTP